MIASVHLADLSVPTALGLLAKPPKPTANPGLRHANIGLAATLSKRVIPAPS